MVREIAKLTQNDEFDLEVSRDVDEGQESVLFCTSGTTGYPKSAEHSHHGALQACINTTRYVTFRATSDACFLAIFSTMLMLVRLLC